MDKVSRGFSRPRREPGGLGSSQQWFRGPPLRVDSKGTYGVSVECQTQGRISLLVKPFGQNKPFLSNDKHCVDSFGGTLVRSGQAYPIVLKTTIGSVSAPVILRLGAFQSRSVSLHSASYADLDVRDALNTFDTFDSRHLERYISKNSRISAT